MSAIEMVTKACRDCNTEKPLSEFHRDQSSRDGATRICRQCARKRSADWKARKVQEVGEEAFRATRRQEMQQRRRNKGPSDKERLQALAYSAAVSELRKRHRAEFEALYRAARYERGLS